MQLLLNEWTDTDETLHRCSIYPVWNISRDIIELTQLNRADSSYSSIYIFTSTWYLLKLKYSVSIQTDGNGTPIKDLVPEERSPTIILEISEIVASVRSLKLFLLYNGKGFLTELSNVKVKDI